MTTVTLTTAVQQVLGPVAPLRKRWVIVQNQGTTNVFLKLDGSSDTLSTANGYLLTPGISLRITPVNPKGTDGQTFIEAVGAAGGEKLNIQWGYYDGV